MSDSQSPASDESPRTWKHRVRWGFYGGVGIILLAVIGGARNMNASSQPASRLGVFDGRLAQCPDSPNCVSTQASDSSHRMDSIPWDGSVAEAIANLEKTIGSLPRTKIVTTAEDYLHVEFTSLIFGFVDDVEFWVSPKDKAIHFRSASRVGYSDLGANRKRMQRFVTQFHQQMD